MADNADMADELIEATLRSRVQAARRTLAQAETARVSANAARAAREALELLSSDGERDNETGHADAAAWTRAWLTLRSHKDHQPSGRIPSTTVYRRRRKNAVAYVRSSDGAPMIEITPGCLVARNAAIALGVVLA